MATSFGFPASISAAGRITKSKVKEKTQETWESMSPEQQQQLKERGHEAMETGKERYEAMTPEKQQRTKQKAKTGAARAKRAWKQLPE